VIIAPATGVSGTSRRRRGLGDSARHARYRGLVRYGRHAHAGSLRAPLCALRTRASMARLYRASSFAETPLLAATGGYRTIVAAAIWRASITHQLRMARLVGCGIHAQHHASSLLPHAYFCTARAYARAEMLRRGWW